VQGSPEFLVTPLQTGLLSKGRFKKPVRSSVPEGA